MEGVTDLLAVQTCPSCLLRPHQPNESLTRTPGLNVSAGRGAVARQRHVVGHGEERAERGDLGGEGHEAVQRQKYTCLARVSPPTAPAWCLCEESYRGASCASFSVSMDSDPRIKLARAPEG